MENLLDSITHIITNRRSVYPKMYTDEPVTDEQVRQILENANWAPTHKKTEPWRFRVLRGKALERLGQFLADDYKRKTPSDFYSEDKYQTMRTKPSRASAVIAIYMMRDPRERLPEWEEIAAVAAAVQNMWLTCTAMGIGSYWSTPSAFIESRDFIPVEPGERCLGLFYIGHWQRLDLPGKRQPVEGKVQWISE